MPPIRNLNNSFVHGAAAILVSVVTPFVQSPLPLISACLICVYAGWFRRAWVASFLGGVIVAHVGWAAFAILISPEIGWGAFIMAPVGLLVILPTALTGYVIGKILSAIAHRGNKAPKVMPD